MTANEIYKQLKIHYKLTGQMIDDHVFNRFAYYSKGSDMINAMSRFERYLTLRSNTLAIL
ncbi:hypothetical protein [Fictibacillus macauensis]|uniref:hypothetical protein n=1 Tax=Fictibacillus macauensis TaxID=245160 RepID=UPI0003030784|nr:hypothetical protein [Fictibacillus macauensis]